jgi:hypothetical protein
MKVSGSSSKCSRCPHALLWEIRAPGLLIDRSERRGTLKRNSRDQCLYHAPVLRDQRQDDPVKIPRFSSKCYLILSIGEIPLGCDFIEALATCGPSRKLRASRSAYFPAISTIRSAISGASSFEEFVRTIAVTPRLGTRRMSVT